MIPRHATDVISLVFGTIFTGFTAVWILTVSDTIDENQAWIGFPVIMIAAGALGLAAALRPRPPEHVAAPYQSAEDADEAQPDRSATDPD